MHAGENVNFNDGDDVEVLKGGAGIWLLYYRRPVMTGTLGAVLWGRADCVNIPVFLHFCIWDFRISGFLHIFLHFYVSVFLCFCVSVFLHFYISVFLTCFWVQSFGRRLHL